MKLSIYSICVFALIFISCATQNRNVTNNKSEISTERLPYITFQKEYIFPDDSSLLRPEDGVALADGRVIVSDQAKGLRIIEKTGSNRPFGNFSDVGFIHNPPETPAAPKITHNTSFLMLLQPKAESLPMNGFAEVNQESQDST